VATVDKIKRAITWIRKSLEITEKTTQPGTISGEIVPTIELAGWDLNRVLEHRNFAGGPGATATITPVVPAGEAHLYVALCGFHTDALANHNVSLVYLSELNEFVQITDSSLMDDEGIIAIDRPFLVPAGATLRVIADRAVGASEIHIKGQFYRFTTAGEYFPGSPWG